MDDQSKTIQSPVLQLAEKHDICEPTLSRKRKVLLGMRLDQKIGTFVISLKHYFNKSYSIFLDNHLPYLAMYKHLVDVLLKARICILW